MDLGIFSMNYTMITNDNKKGAKKSKKFYCEKCDYTTSKVCNWDRHQTTLKHQMITNDNKKEPKGATTYMCPNCQKIYKFASGLSRHKSKCLGDPLKKHELKLDMMNEKLLSLLEELVASNKEPKVINNTNTQNISINMFLNNHCKEAMCLTDFVDNLKLTIKDLLKTKELGYAGGISNIFIKNLSGIPSIKRPIHCSDTKRLQFYVKEEGGWNKDSGKIVGKAIEDVTIKQIKILQEWEKENPNYLESPNLIHTWNLLVHNIMSGASDEERERNKKNIKKKIGETVIIKDAMADI
jgi:hypothetical protein